MSGFVGTQAFVASLCMTVTSLSQIEIQIKDLRGRSFKICLSVR